MLLGNKTQTGGPRHGRHSRRGAEGYEALNVEPAQPPHEEETPKVGASIRFDYFQSPHPESTSRVFDDESFDPDKQVAYLEHDTCVMLPINQRAAAERRRSIQQSCLGLLQLGDTVGALIHVDDGDNLGSSIVFATLRMPSPLDEPDTQLFARPVLRLTPGEPYQAMFIDEGETTVAVTAMRYDVETNDVVVQHCGQYETSVAGEGFGAEDFARFPWAMHPTELILFLEKTGAGQAPANNFF